MTAPSDDYDDDDWGCLCGSPECPDCETECTFCGGDGIGDGCHNPLECCGEDFCHVCRGTGLRAHQRTF